MRAKAVHGTYAQTTSQAVFTARVIHDPDQWIHSLTVSEHGVKQLNYFYMLKQW